MKEKKTNCYSKEKMLNWVFKRFSLVMLLFSITCISAWSQTPGVNFIITPAAINDIEIGEEFTIKVQADFVSGGQLNGAEVHLNFDASYLQVVSLTKTTLLPTTAIELNNNNTGEIEYAAGNSSNISTDFDLITIIFKAIAIPPGGTSSLSFNTVFPHKTDAQNGGSVLLSITGATVNFTTTQNGVACFTDNTTANYAAGTLTNTYVSETTDGEVILKPTAGAEFNTLPPTSEGASYPWTGGTSTVSNGTLIVDGARYNTEPATTTFGLGRSLEFVATFGGENYQHIGFGSGTNATDGGGIYGSPSVPWAMFSTHNTGGGNLYARTSGSSVTDVPLGPAYIGSSHLYRIDWLIDGSFIYSIDGNIVHTTTATINTNMRPAISDYSAGGASVTVDWIRMSPYSASGSFESRIFDATQSRGWGAANWNANTPTNTTLSISVRTGNTATPDATWADWKSLTASGDQVMQNGQYIQYKAEMTTTNLNVTPALLNISFDCTENLPLPVKLTNFKASVAGHDVHLNWSTSTESNNKGFNVQRSIDGRSWQTIGFVNGAGNSTVTNLYAYNDKNLEDGRYYYRLMQVDFDGQFEYSAVEKADVFNANNYLLKQNVPNPVDESTTIQFIIPAKSKTTLSIFDTHGRLIKTLVNEILPAGTHQAIMKKESLSAGIYYYKLQTETFSAIKKMIIQ